MIKGFPLQTERFVLRQFKASDVAAFHCWRDDAEVARYTLWDYPYPMAQAEDFCREQSTLDAFPDGVWSQLMIEDRASGDAIGDIGLGINVNGDGALEIGYSLHRAQWGKGIMTEVLKTLIPMLAKLLGISKFQGIVDARNPASDNVLLKLGFVRGPLVEKASFVKGEWCDEYTFTLEVE